MNFYTNQMIMTKSIKMKKKNILLHDLFKAIFCFLHLLFRKPNFLLLFFTLNVYKSKVVVTGGIQTLSDTWRIRTLNLKLTWTPMFRIRMY